MWVWARCEASPSPCPSVADMCCGCCPYLWLLQRFPQTLIFLDGCVGVLEVTVLASFWGISGNELLIIFLRVPSPRSVSECLLSAFVKLCFICLPLLFAAGVFPALKARADPSSCRPCHRGPVNLGRSRVLLGTPPLTRALAGSGVRDGLCLRSSYWWPVAPWKLHNYGFLR